MKNKILTLLAGLSMCFFAACASEDPEPSLAEKCANGLCEECLLGTWMLNGITNPNVTQYFSGGQFSTPAKLVFKKDSFKTGQLFEYTPANWTKDPVYGTWNINGTSLKLKIWTNGDDYAVTSTTVEPKIDEFQLNLGKVFFQDPFIDDLTMKTTGVEKFERDPSAK